MCGIAGILAAPGRTTAIDDATLARMGDAIAHRGPDDAGSWSDADAGIALVHRRLAVIDLSAAGHQPMASHCGRYVVVYNGELYNHPELRQALGDLPWRGHSDTETLLALFTRHGVVAALPLLVGMFALAVWDRAERRLTLARDRMGEKPLYFGPLADGSLAFGSELRALRAHPQWQGDIDRDALALYLRHGCVPAPRTIHRGSHKLEPASWLQIDSAGRIEQGRYWELATQAARGFGAPLALSDGAAVDELEALLTRSIQGQLIADVPLGAFLSGGIDSSAVVALMARVAPRRVRSFCIGFDGNATSEAAQARAVAQHLGTEHTEFIVGAADALALVPQLARHYDEPFADSSQIPTLMVAQLARRQVTVALSGDGGDELFGGYNRHLIASRWGARWQRLPLAARRAAARLIRALPPNAWDAALAPLQALRSAARRQADAGAKLHKLARDVLPARDAQALYAALTSLWQQPAAIVIGGNDPPSPWLQAAPNAMWRDPVAAMGLADQCGYLSDDILVKVDRASMVHALETRAPLLDHRVVEFAWQLPAHQKIRGGQTKWLLRRLLDRHLPRALIERPKQGFAVPLDAWLRGPLRDWGEALLAPARLQDDGFFTPEPVRAAWAEHQSGQCARGPELWAVLMFQLWLDEQRAAAR